MAYRWLGVLMLSAACVVGCGNDGSGGPRGDGGTGGGGGGGGGWVPACMTSVLCRSCPAEGSCDTNDDCDIGSVCIESGCDSLEGAPIKHCVFAGGGACQSTAMCASGRECFEVPGEGNRCVRTAPGCDTSFDCPLGFSCESGSCFDRRVPCDLDQHCPKNHVCGGTANSSFCLRIHRSCLFDFDCTDLAPDCVDIDGDGNDVDGNKECAGRFDPDGEACVNALHCAGTSDPVCEVAGVGSLTQCGQNGLCLDDTDCGPDFYCADLWPDGRKECVRNGGSCSTLAECPVRQVCAAPRDDDVAGCQAGFQP